MRRLVDMYGVNINVHHPHPGIKIREKKGEGKKHTKKRERGAEEFGGVH